MAKMIWIVAEYNTSSEDGNIWAIFAGRLSQAGETEELALSAFLESNDKPDEVVISDPMPFMSNWSDDKSLTAKTITLRYGSKVLGFALMPLHIKSAVGDFPDFANIAAQVSEIAKVHGLDIAEIGVRYGVAFFSLRDQEGLQSPTFEIERWMASSGADALRERVEKTINHYLTGEV